ncbi:MAG TPA: protocatechuate 3,4-dioxygenase subunit alpha [Gemmatimonadales bacterium]|nr:protocatechuate 3,4-dioxygenase subunit alpha [Gemmatimonadales bacterium]
MTADGRTGGRADGLTPFQTVGPYFAVLPLEGENSASAASTIVIEGTVRDGAGAIVPDALIETWQADATGRCDAADASFRGFARAMTDESGRYEVRTEMPGSIGKGHAPHILVGVLARGVLTRLLTRIYFPGNAANATDPVLALVPESRRATLLASATAPDRYRFDIILQGPGETAFFDA